MLKTYSAIAKPGIILGNAITASGGFALASRKQFDVWLFIATLVGLSLIIASACIFNNCIDRHVDEKMERTKGRALVIGLITTKQAMIGAIFLGASGSLLLVFFTNFLVLTLTLFGFSVYVALYSFLKYRTVHGTLIGSIAGAIPPVVGYCAVTDRFDWGAFLLFLLVAIWQMPHFFAIAIYRLGDYAKAEIPVLPVKKGIRITKIQMSFYIIAFIMVSFLMTSLHYTGNLYLIATFLLGTAWLWLSIKGFKCKNDQRWARQMFLFSLVTVTTLCLVIPFSRP